MAIQQTPVTTLHWNYFLALEQDVSTLSRYIEFSKRNYDTYSLELAHLLFAAASEVDVLAKILCSEIDSRKRPKNISDYQKIITKEFPEFGREKIFIPRYGLQLRPWENWLKAKSPVWWISYNKVKHQRDQHFADATLHNALNAIGALLVLIFYIEKARWFRKIGREADPKVLTGLLEPSSELIKLNQSFYYDALVA